MYDKKIISVTKQALDHPLSQTVTPSRTPYPLERDVLYGRPLTRNTIKFFIALGVMEEFLQEGPTTWDTNDAYIIQEQTKARQLNDAAERAWCCTRLVVQWNTH